MSPFERSKRPSINKSAKPDFPFLNLVALFGAYWPNTLGAIAICVFYINTSTSEEKLTNAIGHCAKAIEVVTGAQARRLVVFVGGWLVIWDGVIFNSLLGNHKM